MDLKWIEDFLYLSQYGSFAKAAKARNITQPAFGRRIKLLEEWVGVDLVNRNTYPATYGVLYLLSKINQRNSRLNTGEV